MNLKNLKYAFIVIIIIIIDVGVYLFFGLLLMNYDDFYDESEGEYWSLESMTFWEKVNYIAFELWNILNLIAIIYIIYRMIKWMKKHHIF